MKSTRQNCSRIKSRCLRFIATSLTVLLLTGGPVQAGPVVISEVIQVIGTYQNPPALRLRSLTQSASGTASNGSTVNSKVTQSPNGQVAIVDTGVSGGSGSILKGVDLHDPQKGVEVIDQGDVEGTICDCGEIIIPGGFPKWPLLFLAAIPLLFIGGGGGEGAVTPQPPPGNPNQFSVPIPTPTPTQPPGNITPFGVTPTPTPADAPIPEPTSLLLFGSGLAVFGARLRRRYMKSKASGS